jgi:hypothetical protein
MWFKRKMEIVIRFLNCMCMKLVIEFDENPLVATGSDDESTEEARKLLRRRQCERHQFC